MQEYCQVKMWQDSLKPQGSYQFHILPVQCRAWAWCLVFPSKNHRCPAKVEVCDSAIWAWGFLRALYNHRPVKTLNMVSADFFFQQTKAHGSFACRNHNYTTGILDKRLVIEVKSLVSGFLGSSMLSLQLNSLKWMPARLWSKHGPIACWNYNCTTRSWEVVMQVSELQ